MIRPVVALLVLSVSSSARAEEPVPYVIIAHAAVKSTKLSKDDIRAMYSKKTSRWADDVAVVPLDLAPASPVRAAFSAAVYGKSPVAVLSEWRQRIFTGQGTPPREIKDDAAMLATVAATPGAIGYVQAGVPLPPQVHAIAVAD